MTAINLPGQLEVPLVVDHSKKDPRYWKDQHWRAPALFERNEPYNQTRLELRMVDLLPEEVLEALRLQFGPAFDQLSHDERLTLAAAASEWRRKLL